VFVAERAEVVRSVAESERVQRFEQQILVHLDDLYRSALRLTGQVADAEDLVQETCVRAFRSLHQLRMPGAAKVWVFSILRSVFLRQLEQRPSHPGALSLEEVDDSVLTSSGAGRDGRGDGLPMDYVRRNEVGAAVLALPLPYREAIILAYVAGFSYREMAQILGLPMGTVMSRLFRGRRMLQARLRERRRPSEAAS